MRRGACPTLAAPMATGDGLLVRLALAEPGLRSSAMAAIARAACDHGNGLIEVSQRGNIQIRGLKPASVSPLAARLTALGILAGDSPAIHVNPLSGIDPAITGEPPRMARAIRSLISDCGPALALPPKLSIVVDGGGALHLDGLTADIRLTGNAAGWTLTVADTLPLCSLKEDDAPRAVFLLLTLLASRNSPVRARALLSQEGATPFLDALAEIPKTAATFVAGRPAAMPVGYFAFGALGIGLAFGQIEAARLLHLCMLAERLDVGTIRPAPGRALIMAGLARETVGELTAEAARLGFITDRVDPRLRISACTGKPGCASAHVETRTLAALIPPSDAHVHISGCPKGCAHPGVADLALVGRADGIAIVRNGRAPDAPVALLPHLNPSALAARVAPYLESRT